MDLPRVYSTYQIRWLNNGLPFPNRGPIDGLAVHSLIYVLSLYKNRNFKTKWQFCQPISHLEFLKSVYGCHGPRAVSEGDIKEHNCVTKWHLQSPLSRSADQKSYPKAAWALVEDDHTEARLCPYLNHKEKHVSLIGDNQGKACLAKWTSCFCPYGPKTFGSSWVSLMTSSQMPQTDS